jgi:hypothetical protein
VTEKGTTEWQLEIQAQLCVSACLPPRSAIWTNHPNERSCCAPPMTIQDTCTIPAYFLASWHSTSGAMPGDRGCDLVCVARQTSRSDERTSSGVCGIVQTLRSWPSLRKSPAHKRNSAQGAPCRFGARQKAKSSRSRPQDAQDFSQDNARSVTPHYGHRHGPGSAASAAQKGVLCTGLRSPQFGSHSRPVRRSRRHTHSARLLPRPLSVSTPRWTVYTRASAGGLRSAKFGRLHALLGSSADLLSTRPYAAPLVLSGITRQRQYV